jgi:hypothetical protein
MKASTPFNLLILLLVLSNGIAFAQPGYYPPPSAINYQADTLTIFPPDSLPVDPVVLLSYNIYVDNEFYSNSQVSDPEDIVEYFLDDETMLPGTRVFCVKAVYNEWISESTCDTATILYGYELPFFEDWSSGSFETLQWTTNSDHWVINSDEGNPAPAVSFQGEPGLTNYEVSLESYPLNAVGLTIGTIWLDFDLKLDANSSSGDEMLKVLVWNSSNQNWITVADYFNDDGSFGWEWQHINIKSQSMNNVFKIRFEATGIISSDIAGWSIDNIHVYRKCNPPSYIELEESFQCNKLDWLGNNWLIYEDWIHWDDGFNSGSSIGTNTAEEFDVAARWDKEQLSSLFYRPFTLYEIAFFPAEYSATYNLRVWTGSGPDSLILDQPVASPVMNEWNTISLENPLEIDTSYDLWIGYHISTPTGYPAGVDDGPAINGYGNMIYLDSAWSTLLEINPDLNFNWNIAGHAYSSTNPFEIFYIYRSTNQEEFIFYDITNQWKYIDSNIVLSDYYCYKVTELWAENGDTCESPPTNTACEVIMLGTGQEENESNIRVYPNPAKDFIKIEAPEKINEVRIYNMLGECEMKLEIGNWEGKVDVSGMENGLYFVEVLTERSTYKSKVLIIR